MGSNAGFCIALKLASDSFLRTKAELGFRRQKSGFCWNSMSWKMALCKLMPGIRKMKSHLMLVSLKRHVILSQIAMEGAGRQKMW